MKVILALLLFTISCQSSQRQDRTSILRESGKTVRVVLLDAGRQPIAGADVELLESKCGPPDCPAVLGWTQKSGRDGSLAIPRNLIHETTLIGTRANEPRELAAARWEQERDAWTLPLIGRVATICSRFDNPRTILVAEDWGSAQIGSYDNLGIMHCIEAKDFFRACHGPQIPDAGFAATFTRSGGNISARLTAETVAGPRELAQLDCFRFPRAQFPPHDLRNWAIEYSLTGGIAFYDRHLRLSNEGDLTITTNPESSRTIITTRAPGDFLAKISAFLKAARTERAVAGPKHPDALNSSLALISEGSRYDLEAPDEIAKSLNQAMESALKDVLVGTWWESGWKLCRPATQLTADQADPPIESLVFQNDGHFSVTWRGGGARAYGDPTGKIPHSAVSDYSGKYSTQPDHSGLHLTFENGIYSPRDFSGDGFFQRDKDKLVLRNLWLGTYKAKQKPDVCELTFTRTSG